jgi:hypothetical protein
MVMFIFHGSVEHDSRLHDMNRFFKAHTSDTLLQFSITFQAKRSMELFEGLNRFENVSGIVFFQHVLVEIAADSRKVNKNGSDQDYIPLIILMA